MPNMPGAGMANKMMDDKAITSMEAMILSMTPKERRFPALMNTSRKKRIAAGSGKDIAAVNKC